MKPKKTITVKLNYHFVDWIVQEYSASELVDALKGENSIEDFAKTKVKISINHPNSINTSSGLKKSIQAELDSVEAELDSD